MKKLIALTSTIANASLLMLGLVLTSCSEPDNSSSFAEADPEAVVHPAIASVFVAAEPENAVTVTAARKTAKPGDTITVAGKVAGAATPFTDGFATAVLSDVTLETCDMIPGDECPTPWDACCADPALIKSSRMTIQVVGEDARPVAQSLKGVKGLKELAPLVVTGTVAEGSSAENLVLNVSGLYLKRE